MQQYTLQQTLEAVQSLNKADQAFSYKVENNQIVGEWKYLDATWAAPLAAGHVDKDFKVTITFDEANHTFTSEDHAGSSESSVSVNPGSHGISFGKETSTFSGHQTSKEFGFGVGQANQAQNETAVGGPTYQYNFDTKQIKDPLFAFLTQYGWQKGKTSFIKKLFGSK